MWQDCLRTASPADVFLSLEERVEIGRFVKERAAGRVPVVTSGHISFVGGAGTGAERHRGDGADALILLTNRLAREEESDEIWLENLKKLLEMLPKDIPLGFYECPYPYKRIISPKLLEWCVASKRFYFIKDTSCDIENIKEKLAVVKGSDLKLFNAIRPRFWNPLSWAPPDTAELWQTFIRAVCEIV